MRGWASPFPSTRLNGEVSVSQLRKITIEDLLGREPVKIDLDKILGYVQGRVALGITGQTVDNGYYQGFMIASIVEGSSLDGTDAQVYDLIVAVDDVKVVDYGTLRAELAKHKVGDTITLKLLRSNQRTGEVTTHFVEVVLKEQTGK